MAASSAVPCSLTTRVLRCAIAVEAQLLGVRSELAAVTGAVAVLHEGLLALQIGAEADWQPRWCRLVAAGGRAAVFEVLGSVRPDDAVHLAGALSPSGAPNQHTIC